MRSLNPSTTAKLFATGFTIGPIVDSLHNQSLLHYNVLPISIAWPSLSSASASLSSSVPLLPLFCSSWTVPPLLGIAYVVLGGILPRILELFLSQETIPSPTLLVDEKKQQQQQNANNVSKIDIQQMLRTRAFIAVATTALIIKLSEILETGNPGMMTTGLSSLFGSSVLSMPLPFLDHRPLDEAHSSRQFHYNDDRIIIPVGYPRWNNFVIDYCLDYIRRWTTFRITICCEWCLGIYRSSGGLFPATERRTK